MGEGLGWFGGSGGREKLGGRGTMEREEEVNGEVVREEMEGWRWVQGIRGGLWAVGWGMSIVGIWGDGF